MTVEIKKVSNKAELKKFIRFNYEFYKDNPYSVPDLYDDMLNTFSPQKNAAFEFCEADYFLAMRDGKIVGRVAAIINHRANETWNKKVVRFGWIDFVDDLDVSRALIDTVKQWGRERGMNEIEGPLGFTDMDAEGMLIDGFDQLSTMATIYNYPYYPEHMNLLGLERSADWVEMKVYIPDAIPEKLVKLSEMIQKRYNLHIKKLTKKDIFEGGYGKKIFNLINSTYKDLYGFSELTDRQIDQYIAQYFPFANLEFITVIEDGNKDNQIAGMGITLPSLSRALQKCKKGRLLPFGWWHMLKVIKFAKTEGIDLLLLGFLPEYRAKGANALLFYDLIPRYIKYGFKWGESQVEMETNGGVQSQWDMFDTVNHKRRRCFKKSL